MKKTTYYLSLIAITAMTFTSCSDNSDDPQLPSKPTKTVGAYILSTGNWGANNGSVQMFDVTTKTAGEDAYKAANGKIIGDAQHMCIYGSKLYVSCTSSAKIEILDKNCKIIKTLNLTNSQNQPINPRYLASGEGKVFFTAQDGTVSEIDTLSMNVTKTLSLGNYPEALSYANGKLYVNQSLYYTMKDGGNTISVVDVASFKKTKDLTVLLNPYNQSVTGEDGYVYFVSNGNYAGKDGLPEKDWVYQTLQKINPNTDKVEEVCKATFIANYGTKMYVIYSEYYLPDTHSIFVYDLEKGTSTPLPIDLKNFSYITGINADPISGELYISDSPYSSPGEVSIYSPTGTFIKKVDAGYSPAGIFFLTK